MSDVKIKSENQSGGITAQNVNTGNNAQFAATSDKKSHVKAFFWWVFGLAGLLAAGVTDYKFLFA